jgi:integrase/recombinase XerC
MAENPALAPGWAPLIREWTRALKAGNKSKNTIEIYERAARQLGAWLAANGHQVEPGELTPSPLRAFLGDTLDRTSPGNTHTVYRSLRTFFVWLDAEDELDGGTPFKGVDAPIVPEAPVPVVPDNLVKRLLEQCAGKDMRSRRDAAIIRLLFDTGCRLSEIANLAVDDVDLDLDVIRVLGKGRRPRAVPFGAKTGQAISRYLRVRAKERYATSPKLWLCERNRGPLQPNGNAIKIMLRRRGQAIGVEGLHAHQFRHTLAHEWRKAGGDPTSLMRHMGWRSESMLTRYGASVADERAQTHSRELNLGDRL